MRTKFNNLSRNQQIAVVAGGVSLVSILLLAASRRSSKKEKTPSKPKPKPTETPGLNHPFIPTISKEMYVKSHKIPSSVVQARAKDIGNVTYNILLHLRNGSTFKGLVEISFDLASNEAKSSATLDFQGESISSMFVNGKSVSLTEQGKSLWDGQVLTIPQQYLAKIGNKVVLSFEAKYEPPQKIGLRRIQEGKYNYIFADTSNNGASLIFPCFDQNNIRAKFNLQVLSPDNWPIAFCQPRTPAKNLSYIIPTQIAEYIKLCEKEPNLVLSCYDSTPLITVSGLRFAAGDYHHIKLGKDPNPKAVPISLLCRASTVGKLENNTKIYEVFAQLAIKYCEAFLGNFPVKEMNHLFLPVRNDNQGNFIDDGALKGNPSRQKLIQTLRAIVSNTVFTYFGLTVTHNKWEDAWIIKGLREIVTDLCLSFIISTLKTDESYTRIHEIYNIEKIDFELNFQSSRREAYLLDQGSSTHPLSLQCNDSEEFAYYCKSPVYLYKSHAVMKQLYFILENENFKKILKSLITKSSSRPLSSEEFLGIVEQVIDQNRTMMMGKSLDHFITVAKFDISQFSIHKWWQNWVKTDGINELTVHWDADNNFFKNMLKISQTVYNQTNSNRLRHHRIKIALFNNEAKLFIVKEVFIEDIESTPLIFEDAKRIPSAILTNYDSESYAKITLDNTSLEFFKGNVDRIEDVESLGTIWRVFYKEVRENLMTAEQYLYLARVYIRQSDSMNLLITEILLQDCIQIIHNFLAPSKKKSTLRSMFETLKTLFEDNKDTFSWFNVLIFSYLPNFCVSKEDVVYILENLDAEGLHKPPIIEIKKEKEFLSRIVLLMQVFGFLENERAAVSAILGETPAEMSEYYTAVSDFLRLSSQLKNELYEYISEFVMREKNWKVRAVFEGIRLTLLYDGGLDNPEKNQKVAKYLTEGLRRVFTKASVENLSFYVKFIGENLQNCSAQVEAIEQLLKRYEGVEEFKTRNSILAGGLENLKLRAKVLQL